MWLMCGCGPSSPDGPNYEVAVRRTLEGGSGRIWIVQTATGAGRRLPRGPAVEEVRSQECIGWARGVGLHVLERYSQAWTYKGGEPSTLLPFSAFFVTETLLLPDGTLAVVERRGSGLLPGSNPPPSVSELSLIDADGMKTTVGGTGVISELSGGDGPLVLAHGTAYHFVPPQDPRDPQDYGSYSESYGWWLYDEDGPREVAEEHPGDPVLSPGGRWLAWIAAGEVTVTGLEGAVDHTATGEGFDWGPGERYAIHTGEQVRIVDMDGGGGDEFAAPGVRRLAWSPEPDRLLVEYECEGSGLYRHEVVDGTRVIFATECGAHEFELWAPDAEAIAVRETAQTGTPRFRVMPFEDEATPWIEGVVCAFRPS